MAKSYRQNIIVAYYIDACYIRVNNFTQGTNPFNDSKVRYIFYVKSEQWKYSYILIFMFSIQEWYISTIIFEWNYILAKIYSISVKSFVVIGKALFTEIVNETLKTF